MLTRVVLLLTLLRGLLSATASRSGLQGSENYLEYYMLEELPARSLVGNLVRDYGLDHQYSPAVLASLRFTMLTQSQLEHPNFAVDELTGDIHLASNRLDRETICPRRDQCLVKFDVAVQPIQYFQIIKVSVEIVDVNDNAPVFPQRVMTHEISELAEPRSTALAVPPATDLDSSRYAVHRYDVIPRDGKFRLTSRATADGGTDLRLVLRERLDREVEDRYMVTVLAVDGGDPAHTGSIVVRVFSRSTTSW